MRLDQFSNSRKLDDSVQSGFYFHPSDEDLSLGTPVEKSHLRAAVSVCIHWKTAKVRKKDWPWPVFHCSVAADWRARPGSFPAFRLSNAGRSMGEPTYRAGS
jgi:hypothetical protein